MPIFRLRLKPHRSDNPKLLLWLQKVTKDYSEPETDSQSSMSIYFTNWVAKGTVHVLVSPNAPVLKSYALCDSLVELGGYQVEQMVKAWRASHTAISRLDTQKNIFEGLWSLIGVAWLPRLLNKWGHSYSRELPRNCLPTISYSRWNTPRRLSPEER